MLFLSQIVGQPILDRQGEQIASIKDTVIRIDGAPHPPVIGLVARVGRRDFFIPWSQVLELESWGAKLLSFSINLQPFSRRDGEILLARDVLDKQVIDVHGRRVIRVNDLQLASADGSYHLAGADLSPFALLRRLGPRALTERLAGAKIMDWANVEYFASEAPAVHLKVSHERIARLHPVEIAKLVDTLPYRQGAEIVGALDDQKAANTLGEMTEERQADILETMEGDRAADILEKMAPDDAADLLGSLPEKKAEELLGLMEAEESADVKELLSYDEDTAGGVMTTEYLAVPQHLTAAEAIDYIRHLPAHPPLVYYVFVIRAHYEPVLVGMVTIGDLISAPPSARLEQFMSTDLQVAHPEDSAEDVARTIAEYNLLALPVVDQHGRILGMVTVDDAMEIILPESWRRRLPRFFS